MNNTDDSKNMKKFQNKIAHRLEKLESLFEECKALVESPDQQEHLDTELTKFRAKITDYLEDV